MAEELSPSEVARRLGTSTRTVQRWIESGKLPARRVGGRWRVANVAFDAFGGRRRSGRRAIDSPIRRLFIANRGEIARADRAHLRPARDRRDRARDGRARRARPARRRGRRRGGPGSRRRRGPPRVRVPGRERRLRRGRRRCRAALGRPAAGRDPGDGRQGRGPPARRVARRPGAPRLRRRRTSPTPPWPPRPAGSATRCWSSRRPAAAARGCGPSASRTALARCARVAPGARRPRPSATTG